MVDTTVSARCGADATSLPPCGGSGRCRSAPSCHATVRRGTRHTPRAYGARCGPDVMTAPDAPAPRQSAPVPIPKTRALPPPPPSLAAVAGPRKCRCPLHHADRSRAGATAVAPHASCALTRLAPRASSRSTAWHRAHHHAARTAACSSVAAHRMAPHPDHPNPRHPSHAVGFAWATPRSVTCASGGAPAARPRRRGPPCKGATTEAAVRSAMPLHAARTREEVRGGRAVPLVPSWCHATLPQRRRAAGGGCSGRRADVKAVAQPVDCHTQAHQVTKSRHEVSAGHARTQVTHSQVHSQKDRHSTPRCRGVPRQAPTHVRAARRAWQRCERAPPRGHRACPRQRR